MTNIFKNKFFISLFVSSIISVAFLSTTYAAEITVSTQSASSVSSSDAILKGSVDTTSNHADVWFTYGTNSAALDKSTQKNAVDLLSFGIAPFTEAIHGLEPNTIYFFRANAQNRETNFQVSGEILPFTTNSKPVNDPNTNSGYDSSSAPEVTTNYVVANSIDSNSAILDAYIKSNGSNTVAWFTYWPCKTNDASNQETEKWRVNVTDYQTDFQQKIIGLMPDTCYYFRGEAENNNGTTSGNDRVFITKGSSNGLIFAQPTASTTSAMLVRETTALLNGNVVPHNAETSVWFEWSENPEMTIGLNRNASQSAGSGDNEVYTAYSLTNLTLNKTYYFRVVAQNTYGTTKGNVNKFTTVKTADPVIVTSNSNTPVTNTYVKPRTQSKSVTLEAEFDDNNPNAGTKVVYAINYKNVTASVLKDAILKITLPNEVVYMASSFASVGQSGNVLTFKIGDIASKGYGIISVKIKITDLARAQNLKFNAEISYSDNNEKAGKENLVSELQISEYSLAASVLETLGSIFSNLFVDFILGLIIGAGTYHYYVVVGKKGESDAEDPLK